MIRFLSVRTDGTVVRQGVETPKGTRLVKRDGDTLVVKVPGHSFWVGLNLPHKYASAEYEVYRVLNDTGATTVEVERLTSFPVRS